MLERQDGRAADIVIAQDGAGRVESRRMRQAGGAKRRVGQRHIKGNAATGAKRTVQELDLAPAIGAKAPARRRLAAGDAERRKQQVQQPLFQMRPMPLL